MNFLFPATKRLSYIFELLFLVLFFVTALNLFLIDRESQNKDETIKSLAYYIEELEEEMKCLKDLKK